MVAEGMISADDMNLLQLADNAEQAVDLVVSGASARIAG